MSDDKKDDNGLYYHCTSALLKAGSIIEPGNWGRMIRLYGQGFNGNVDILLREAYLEKIRETHFSDKPSRFNCNFMLKSIEDAQFYKQTTTRKTDIIYKVRIVNDSYKIHEGNWGQCQPINWSQQHSIIDSMEECARDYWMSKNTENSNYNEYLVNSDIEIIERFYN